MGSDDPCLLPATGQARALRDGSLGAVELVTAHLARIERINPAVNAIVTLVADRAIAAAEGRRPPARLGRPLPPLHGLPIAHKDLVDTAGVRTTYGSPSYRDHVPAEDALLAARLRERRRDPGRQDQHARVGRGLAHLQPGVRRHPQSVGHDPLGRRLERRRRGRAGLPDGAARRRQRPGRVAAKPGRLERPRGPAADAGRRPGLAVAHPLAAVLGRRADGPHGRRRGAAPGCDGRARPAGAALAARRTARSGRAARRRPARPPGRVEPVARRPAGGAGGARRGRGRGRAAGRDRPRRRGGRARPDWRRPRLRDLAGVHVRGLARRPLRQRRRPHEGDRALERRARPGAHVGRPDRRRPPARRARRPRHRVLRALRLPRLPGHPGRAVPGRDRVPAGGGRRGDGLLPRVDAVVLARHHHVLPGDLDPRRAPRRPACRSGCSWSRGRSPSGRCSRSPTPWTS